MKTTTPLSQDSPKPEKTYRINKDIAKKVAILLLPLTFLVVVLIRVASHGNLGLSSYTAEVSGKVFQNSTLGPTPLEAVEVSIMSNGKRYKSTTDKDGSYTLLFDTDFPDQEKFVNRRVVARYNQYETVGKNVRIPKERAPVLEEINITIGKLGYSAEEKAELNTQIASQHRFADNQVESLKVEIDSLYQGNMSSVTLIEFQKLINLYEQKTTWLLEDSLLFSADMISIERMRTSLVKIATEQDSLLQEKGKLLYLNQP